jgi:acyl dehydratase
MPSRSDDPSYGKITPEGVARMRARIGVPVPQDPPINRVAHEDTIRRFAYGYGDDNPLWSDPDHAAASPWGGIVAPPGYLLTMGLSETKEIPPEVRARGAGALAGVHEFFSGNEWEWFVPVRPGDRLTKLHALIDVQEKQSAFGGGQSVLLRYRTRYRNQREETVAHVDHLFIRTERQASGKTRKYSEIARPTYSEADRDAVDAEYENEYVRGAEPRYWEDVEVGEELPGLVKGPLVVSDIIAWMGGWGGGIRAFRLQYQHRKRHPGFYNLNELGAWDTVERCHWDDGWAQKIGNPAAYDFGRMRTCFLVHALCNWMGNHGWLWKLGDQMRRFNFIGDLTHVKGRVTAKQRLEAGAAVELEVWCENQRGETTAPGRATVLLPFREDGPVRLPPQPEAG